MNACLGIWKTGRENIARLLSRVSDRQMNEIPQGHSNNLAWNLGHLIVVQQSLVYRLSGLEMRIPAGLNELYKPGTRPGEPLSSGAIGELKALLLATVDTTLEDYSKGAFGPYLGLTTSRGFHLETLEDGLSFNNFHEGLHTGTMMALLKLTAAGTP